MMPIMYALAKYANGNIDEILQKIDEGENFDLAELIINLFKSS